MKEIWLTATSSAVLPATLLLIPIALYWLIGMLGIFDFDGVSDGGGDGIDLDGDGHADADGDGHSDGIFSSLFGGMLKLVNASDIPLMVVLSLIVVFFWGAMMIGATIMGSGMDLFAWAVGIGSLVVALICTRYFVILLKPFFRVLKKDTENHVPVVGRTGHVRSNDLTSAHGQIEVEDPQGLMYFNARLLDGDRILAKGDEVLIFAYEKQRGFYYVKPLN